ncbi:BamA/TamA family outer membrane protein [Arundinibacter roseus]|uniref:Bacterial surface antigen (D15) domain-containing protein n=1 Tax=Arundinibacter roseus TaxID=2070510 RepID=A0A4R4K4T2_9BACT|nr:BamA/TamA family outer membrane protein [Arundinibacter roseus]TDB62263.1 hypothetical protein EZE20_17920 [Arundinibacter roseus]
MRLYTLLLLGAFLKSSFFSYAQPQTPPDTVVPTGLRDLKFIALPVLFRLPETRWGGGIAGTATFGFAGDVPSAKPSQVTFGATFTQNKQILLFVPFSIFYDSNRYYFNGENGWYKFNYFYYGIGENRVEQERFDVTFPRIRLLASRLVAPNTYAGIRYQFENYNVTGRAAGGELATGRITGSEFSRTSSLGISLLRDTRDSVFYPRKGLFGELYILPTSPIFGADHTFTRLNLDVANYFSVNRKLVLATNYVASSVLGKQVPFSQLSFLGGQKKMRGVYEGFFRDKNALLGQAELRWEVWRFIGLTGFGAVGFLGDERDLIRLGKPKYTYGMGLRITGQKKTHLNVRLDYGLSPYGPGNFYATIGEAF